MVEVSLKCVIKEPLTGRCMILFESCSGLEVLPIPVGSEAACALNSFMCGKQPDKLNIFGIVSGIIDVLDNAFIERVVIDSYENGVFTSKVYIIVNGEERHVDARPSDAVIFSLFTKVPLYVSRQLLSEKFSDRMLCFKKNCCG